MAHPVLTFPQPPPTSNTLTSHQRQQLLRSTRKLTKLLGSAPQLADHDSPSQTVYLDLSSKLQHLSGPPRSYEFPRSPSPTSSISSVSTTTSKVHHKTRFPSRSENCTGDDALGSHFSIKRPPMLRLASLDDEIWARTKLDTVPGSPPAATDTDSSQLPDASDVDFADRLVSPINPPITPIAPSISRSFTLTVPQKRTSPSPFIETLEPTFKVTSEAAARRLKMERIRKRLGECVPVETVFPHELSDDVEADGDYVEITAEKKPSRVNIDLRPRWKSSPTVVAFDVIYEGPDERGGDGLEDRSSLASGISKNPTFKIPSSSSSAPPRPPGKLVKRSRREPRF